MPFAERIRRAVAAALPPGVRDRLRPHAEALDARLAALRWEAEVLCGRLERLLVRRPIPPGPPVHVHLGCGAKDHPGMVNVDGYPHRHVHFVRAIDRLPMFADESVDLVYASHCLEHFGYRQVDRVLQEWTRVLRPGGVLRLSVPDLDRLLAIYHQTGDPGDIVEQLMGGQNNRFNFHLAVFSRRSLQAQLERAGLVLVTEWSPGADPLSPADDFASWAKEIGGRRYPVSLNLQAVKPGAAPAAPDGAPPRKEGPG